MKSKNGARALTAVLLILALCWGPLAARTGPVTEMPTAGENPGWNEEPGRTPALKRAIKDFVADTGDIWSAPFRLKNRDVAPLIVLAATTTFLIAADESIRRSVKSYADVHGWVHDVGSTVTHVGGIGAWAAAGAFYGAGIIFRDDRAKGTGSLASAAMLQSFLVVSVIKGLSGRQRPCYEDGADHWAGPVAFFKRYEKGNDGLYNSFPSGHAAAAFSLATVVALQYRHRPWVAVLAYALAAGVGLSRMTEDRHWTSDVLVGAVIGHLVARLVVYNHNKRRRLVPVLGCARRSVTFGFQYVRDPDH
jgi:membrane-associated phospholipid phosphatase